MPPDWRPLPSSSLSSLSSDGSLIVVAGVDPRTAGTGSAGLVDCHLGSILFCGDVRGGLCVLSTTATAIPSGAGLAYAGDRNMVPDCCALPVLHFVFVRSIRCFFLTVAEDCAGE